MKLENSEFYYVIYIIFSIPFLFIARSAYWQLILELENEILVTLKKRRSESKERKERKEQELGQ